MYQKIFAQEKNSEVVIIDIDEQSLGKFGQFPWNRTVFAKILDQLNTANPKAIGFDIFFTEKDKQSPEEIIKSYDLIPSDITELQKLKGPDDLFAEKLKESKSVIAVLGSNVPSHSNYDRKAKARFLSKGGEAKTIYIFLSIFYRLIRKIRKKCSRFGLYFFFRSARWNN